MGEKNNAFSETMFKRLGAKLSLLEDTEADWCRFFNRGARKHGTRLFFTTISRLGDGVFWYVTMLGLVLVWGRQALPVVAKMLLTGLVGLIIYKAVKSRTKRPRPAARHLGLNQPVAPLDEYSFPSGHSLHAVAFTIILGAYFPMLLWLMVPMALLIAMSRLILGLHYPSDVVGGAAIGCAIASIAVL